MKTPASDSLPTVESGLESSIQGQQFEGFVPLNNRRRAEEYRLVPCETAAPRGPPRP